MTMILEGEALRKLSAAVEEEIRQELRRRASLPYLYQQLSRRSWRLDDLGYRLDDIAVIVRDDAVLYPVQCRAILEHLAVLRTSVQRYRDYLDTLPPALTERVKPYGCIMQLASLDYRLTDAILTLAMFFPLCQSVEYPQERLMLHLLLRSKFPPILTAYHAAMVQLAALRELVKQQDQGERAAL